MAHKAVPPVNPKADSTVGGHHSRVKKVISHHERHGESAHHDHPGNLDHGFGSIPSSGHGGVKDTDRDGR